MFLKPKFVFVFINYHWYQQLYKIMPQYPENEQIHIKIYSFYPHLWQKVQDCGLWLYLFKRVLLFQPQAPPLQKQGTLLHGLWEPIVFKSFFSNSYSLKMRGLFSSFPVKDNGHFHITNFLKGPPCKINFQWKHNHQFTKELWFLCSQNQHLYQRPIHLHCEMHLVMSTIQCRCLGCCIQLTTLNLSHA